MEMKCTSWHHGPGTPYFTLASRQLISFIWTHRVSQDIQFFPTHYV